MRHAASYDEPFAWWGAIWSPPRERTVVDLITDGVLSAKLAGLLWALLARRASIVVAAGPSGAGKTTLLTALLDFLPPDTRRLYLRGCYESFGFLEDPTIDPARTVLLVNEISAHLPTYLWGPAVRRVFAAAGRGFGLAATAHATSVAELVAGLTGHPLRVPLRDLAAVDVVVLLDAWEAGGSVLRVVREVWILTRADEARGGLAVARVAAGTGEAPAEHDLSAVARIVGRMPGPSSSSGHSGTGVEQDIAERTAALEGLAAASPAGAASVRALLVDAGTRWTSFSERGSREPRE